MRALPVTSAYFGCITWMVGIKMLTYLLWRSHEIPDMTLLVLHECQAVLQQGDWDMSLCAGEWQPGPENCHYNILELEIFVKPISLVTQDLTLGDDSYSVTQCRLSLYLLVYKEASRWLTYRINKIHVHSQCSNQLSLRYLELKGFYFSVKSFKTTHLMTATFQ